jgi:hypothetical protein
MQEIRVRDQRDLFLDDGQLLPDRRKLLTNNAPDRIEIEVADLAGSGPPYANELSVKIEAPRQRPVLADREKKAASASCLRFRTSSTGGHRRSHASLSEIDVLPVSF